MPYIKKVQMPNSGNFYDLRDIEALHYKGKLGSGETLVLPTPTADNKGDVYEVITAGTYDGKTAKVGDLFLSTGSMWIHIEVTDTNTTYTFSSGDNNGQIKITPSDGQAQNVSVTGLGSAAYKDATNDVTENSVDVVTSGAVYTAIANLPKPMVYKGTVGTNGDVANVPMDGSADIGDTYKVITAGTQGGYTVKVGDLLTCLTKTSSANTWSLIPSGDEQDDTWRAIWVNGIEALASGISSGNVDFVNGDHVSITFDDTDNSITISIPDLATTTVGSASAGSPISADEITGWTANTPTAVTLPTCYVQDEVLIFTAGDVTAGTAATLTHTQKSIPNISVDSVTVVTGYDTE